MLKIICTLFFFSTVRKTPARAFFGARPRKTTTKIRAKRTLRIRVRTHLKILVGAADLAWYKEL